MFAMPVVIGAVVLADSYLVILNLEYAVAKPVLILLAVDMLCMSISTVFSAVVRGTETFNVEAKISYKSMIRSKLFLLLSLPYIKAAISLPVSFFLLDYEMVDPMNAATYLAAIILTGDSGMAIVNYVLARRSCAFTVQRVSVLKYVRAAFLMALLLYVVPHPTRLSLTVAVTLLGVCFYRSLLALIDP